MGAERERRETKDERRKTKDERRTGDGAVDGGTILEFNGDRLVVELHLEGGERGEQETRGCESAHPSRDDVGYSTEGEETYEEPDGIQSYMRGEETARRISDELEEGGRGQALERA
jgi:hypothetical protein